jgi:hypothetical protein
MTPAQTLSLAILTPWVLAALWILGCLAYDWWINQ